MLRVDPVTASVIDPPVALAKSWVAGRSFRPEHPLIDLSQAVPSYPPPEALREHLADVVMRADTGAYAPALGLPHTRAAVAAHFTDAYGASVAAGQVMITSGCNQSYCLAISTLAGRGDEVILPVPYYFNHDMWLRANGIAPVYVGTNATGMVPSAAAIAASVTPRTRALVLVTPNNPAGIVYPPALMEACFDLCAERGIALVLDETYKDFRATTAPAHGLFARPEWPQVLVHLFSFSKVFSLAGYRVGSLVADPGIIANAMKLADCETIGAPRISQEAVAFGLTQCAEWVEGRRAEMAARVEAMADALATRPGGFELVSAGAYFAWVRHPFALPARTVAQRLADEHDVLTIPGDCFGPGQDRYLRMAFGNVGADDLAALAGRLRATAP